MGQSVVDLPDPLEKQPGSASSADDLLSQLAGDEIDRLLTEADVDAEPPVEEPPAAAMETIAASVRVAPAAAGGTPPVTQADALLKIVEAQNQEAQKQPVIEAAQATTDTLTGSQSDTLDQAELDKLLSTVAATPAGEAVAEAAKVDIDQTLAAEADAKLAPQTADLHADAAEAAALNATVVAPPDASNAKERESLLATVAADSTDEDLTEGPLPLWLRPLEWLNAPMDALSDEVRSFFGKVAILTLVNSAAVIIYVMMFRRH